MSRMKLTVVVAIGLGLALALAFFVSPQASSEPDGLNRVAMDQGFDDEQDAHALQDSPLAGYGVHGVDDDRLSKGLAGVIGVLTTFAIGGGLLFLARRTRKTAE